ncbi:MAG: virulence RhuM family protein [Bacteroidales bacterium]|nr:virulence RhuM family protein [Bacteroidales bacterium]
MDNGNNGEIIIYQSEDGNVQLDVRLENETVWLTIDQMALLFGKARSTINEHILNVFQDGELNENVAVRKIGISDYSTKPTNYYNLDVIISVGYRVHSIIGTRFRQWATGRLREYIVKGFTMDDKRLKGNGGGMYWKELLDRIRDIRSSEKVLYRQVLDLYATSVDYNPNAEESIRFFKIVQNKLHYAAHGHTAAEVIYERADADKPFMGLTSFDGDLPTLKDTKIAKNYLTADELKVLNNIVSGYFDFAEIQAIRHRPMYMEDYIKQLDGILAGTGEKLLPDAGSISHQQAIDKAEKEYRKYQIKTLSPVEEAYLKTLKQLEKEAVSFSSEHMAPQNK